jgi:IS30 family transposase
MQMSGLEFSLEAQHWLLSRRSLLPEKANQPPEARTFFNNHEEEADVSYQQLTLEERYQIYTLRKQHFSYAEIAREVGRHRTTIARELNRNVGVERSMCSGYMPTVANKLARQRRILSGALRWKIRGDLKQVIEEKLMQSWSPEQISGRMLRERGFTISAETIYQHVIRDDRTGGLLRYGQRQGRQRHPRLTKLQTADRARARLRHIDNRPAAANDRTELGHWERDCIVGTRGKSALLVAVDRKSRFTKISRVDATTVKAVARETLRMLDGLPVESVTNDNGTEFNRATALEMKLGARVYVCDPSSPWQRGTIENTNGLIRQYVPKRTNFDDIRPSAATAIEETLNHRPRKVLGYRTPYEAFFDEESILMTKRKQLHFGLEFAGFRLIGQRMGRAVEERTLAALNNIRVSVSELVVSRSLASILLLGTAVFRTTYLVAS